MNQNKKTDMSPKEAQELGQELVGMMQALTSIMNVEMDGLKRKDMKCVEAASREKIQLLREYQKSLVVVAQNPEILKTVDAGLREQLRQTCATCEGTALRNNTSLKGALRATQTLIETIVNAAIKSTKTLDNYTDPRTKHLELGTHDPVCRPVAFCRVV